MHAGRALKRKPSPTSISDVQRRVRATAFQSLPPSTEELKGALQARFGSVEHICKLTDPQGSIQFQILFANVDSAAKAIEHGEFEGTYGPMQRRIACKFKQERRSQHLRSHSRPEACSVPHRGGAVSASPLAHSDGHPPGAPTEDPHPAPPIFGRRPIDNTPRNTLSGIDPHVLTHPANSPVSSRAKTTTPLPAFGFYTSPTTSVDGMGPNQLTDEISKLKIELAVRDNEVAQLREKLEDPSSHDWQQAVVGGIKNSGSGNNLAAKVAHQSTEIARLEDEVSLLKARDSQSEEDKKDLQTQLKRKVARIRAVTGNVNRMHAERVKLIARNTMAKRRLNALGEELKIAREASDRSQEALRNQFDTYKQDQLRIRAQFQHEHEELLRASVANQAKHQELLHRVQTALDERSKQVVLLEGQRDQGVSQVNRHVDILRSSLFKTERAAVTAHEKLSVAERALVDNQREYEKKCADISEARCEISSLHEALTIQERTHEAAVQQLQQHRLIDNQRYKAQLSREQKAFEAALFQAQLRAQEAVRAEASSKEAFSALDIARREMSDQIARERDAYAGALARAEDDVRHITSLLDTEREIRASLQEKIAQTSKPVAQADGEAQTEPVLMETPALQNCVPPHALDTLLQAFVAMHDIGISVAPRATSRATDQH